MPERRLSVAWEVRCGDALDELRAMGDESVHCCVTSPPYFGLRDALPGWSGRACLIEMSGEHFVVSSVHAYSGFETLIFRSDADGNVERYLEVGGGHGMDRAEAIGLFEEDGPSDWDD